MTRRAAATQMSTTTPGKLVKKTRLHSESPIEPTAGPGKDGDDRDSARRSLFQVGFAAESVLRTFTNIQKYPK